MMYICPACPDAAACIRGGPELPDLRGEVKFYQKRGAVLVCVHVSGLPRESETGFFALHIHEGGGGSGEGFSDTGGHYSPCQEAHPQHAGDLPALLSCGGGAYLAVLTDRFCVADVIGRTVVIHAGADDLHTQPAGGAGAKIACGGIHRTNAAVFN